MALRLSNLCLRALQNAGTIRGSLVPKRSHSAVADIIPDRPEKLRFGWLRITLVVVPTLYLGATISQQGAAFLEENEIFVPSDDDDD